MLDILVQNTHYITLRLVIYVITVCSFSLYGESVEYLLSTTRHICPKYREIQNGMYFLYTPAPRYYG